MSAFLNYFDGIDYLSFVGMTLYQLKHSKEIMVPTLGVYHFKIYSKPFP